MIVCFQLLCLIVEEESDIAAFANYDPATAGDGESSPEPASAPPPPAAAPAAPAPSGKSFPEHQTGTSQRAILKFMKNINSTSNCLPVFSVVLRSANKTMNM